MDTDQERGWPGGQAGCAARWARVLHTQRLGVLGETELFWEPHGCTKSENDAFWNDVGISFSLWFGGSPPAVDLGHWQPPLNAGALVPRRVLPKVPSRGTA